MMADTTGRKAAKKATGSSKTATKMSKATSTKRTRTAVVSPRRGAVWSKRSEVQGRTVRTPSLNTVRVKAHAADLFEVPGEVQRVVSALGSNTVADLLGVSRSQPSRWRNGEERISPTNRARLADLDHVLNRLLQVLWPEDAGAWLTARNPHLAGRPVDVLALRGSAPVVEAIDALAQGAYA
jgi:uncharacterized protein (DUF2384 family)